MPMPRLTTETDEECFEEKFKNFPCSLSSKTDKTYLSSECQDLAYSVLNVP